MSALFECKPQIVPAAWIDYSGHMNIGYYQLAFEYAASDFFQHLDLSGPYRARTNHAQFALESHINFLREVVEGDTLHFTGQLLGYDPKRTRAFFSMHNVDKDYLAATNEVMYLHVSLAERRSVPYPAEIVARLETMSVAQANLPRPAQAGRSIGFPEKAKST